MIDSVVGIRLTTSFWASRQFIVCRDMAFSVSFKLVSFNYLQLTVYIQFHILFISDGILIYEKLTQHDETKIDSQ